MVKVSIYVCPRVLYKDLYEHTLVSRYLMPSKGFSGKFIVNLIIHICVLN